MVDDIRIRGTRMRIQELAKEMFSQDDTIGQIILTKGEGKVMYQEFYIPYQDVVDSDPKICGIEKKSQDNIDFCGYPTINPIKEDK